MSFISKLENLIVSNNMNWRSFSSKIGIPYTTIMSWRNVDTDNIKLKTARQISNFFQVSLDYWLEDSPEDSFLDYREYVERLKALETEDPAKLRIIREMIGMSEKNPSALNSFSKIG